MRKKRWPIITGVLVVAAATAFFLISPNLNQAPTYETYEVASTEVVKTVGANGQFAETEVLAYGPSEQPILIAKNGTSIAVAQFGVSLEIESIAVELGEVVEAGDLLFTYLNQLDQEVEVEAVSPGVVRSVDAAKGFRTSTAVLTIGSGDPIVSVFVSEYDADLVDLGQVAVIELDAINVSFTGKVVLIGQVAQSVSGIKQYEVLLSVSKLPDGARFGMSATAEIEVLKNAGVLAVPISALVGEDAPQLDILTADADGVESVERIDVELGLFGDSFVEVVAGVEAGDQVVTGVTGSIPSPVNFGPPPGARQSD